MPGNGGRGEHREIGVTERSSDHAEFGSSLQRILGFVFQTLLT